MTTDRPPVNEGYYSMTSAQRAVIAATREGALTKSQAHVLLVIIVEYASWSDGGGVYAANSTIGEACGMSAKTVARAKRALEALGWLQIERVQGQTDRLIVTPTNLDPGHHVQGGRTPCPGGGDTVSCPPGHSVYQPKKLPKKSPNQEPKKEVEAAQDSTPSARDERTHEAQLPAPSPDEKPEEEPEPVEPPRHSGDDLQRLESWLVDQLEDYRCRADSTGSALGETARLMSGLSEQLRDPHAPDLRVLCQTIRAMCLEMACRDNRPSLHRATGYLLEDVAEWLDEQIQHNRWRPALRPAPPAKPPTPEQVAERNAATLALIDQVFGDELGLELEQGGAR